MFSGGIIAFSGAIVDIPTGWVLCNGSNGTPDLRNRMIICAGDSYVVGASGGATTHGHTDTFSVEAGLTPEAVHVGDENINVATETHEHVLSGAVASGNSMNPYYALAFIMKT